VSLLRDLKAGIVPSMIVVFEALEQGIEPPKPATTGSAGYDVRAVLSGLPPGERALIPLGFKAQLPRGCEAQIRMRSSFALHRGLIIPNAPATIDPDYPGEWMVLIANIGRQACCLTHGERFAQIVFASFLEPTWLHGIVTPSSERRGGAGSTGVD
jgi:dUTP pyrophosphatase